MGLLGQVPALGSGEVNPPTSLTGRRWMAPQSGGCRVGGSVFSATTCVFDLIVPLTQEAPKSPYEDSLGAA